MASRFEFAHRAAVTRNSSGSLELGACSTDAWLNALLRAVEVFTASDEPACAGGFCLV